MNNLFSQQRLIEMSSWVLMGLGLLTILWAHLLAALLAGLLVYQLVHLMAPVIQKRLFSKGSRLIAVLFLLAVILGILVSLGTGLVLFFNSDAGNLTNLFQKLADILDDTRERLPVWVLASLPSDPIELKNLTVHWIREHASLVTVAGQESFRILTHLLLGTIIGALLAVREVVNNPEEKILAHALTERLAILGDAFKRVVFAQVTISAINTFFTAVYLLILLPSFGVKVPFAKTLIILTFLVGLIPVLGNLISNTLIVTASLANSILIAGISLAFLIVIHKLEYFLNAKIIGSKIQARAWELLAAMLLMESLFGLQGIIAAPIYYAYLKKELTDRQLV